jgi:hypothetical protein
MNILAQRRGERLHLQGQLALYGAHLPDWEEGFRRKEGGHGLPQVEQVGSLGQWSSSKHMHLVEEVDWKEDLHQV